MERRFKIGDLVMLNWDRRAGILTGEGEIMSLTLEVGTVGTVVKESVKECYIVVRTHKGRWRRDRQTLIDLNLPDVEGLYIGVAKDFTLLQESPNKRLRLIDKR